MIEEVIVCYYSLQYYVAYIPVVIYLYAYRFCRQFVPRFAQE